ncbi:hypothetical protein [Anaerosporobacter faecicola]|uniref:hypothetical protein n=1 Tax=Anaerosporobacter faecicola TaxID=2718714 RepID=UPI0014397B30|nr:hypothetical protein [Anaerosporobacter faecicola]
MKGKKIALLCVAVILIVATFLRLCGNQDTIQACVIANQGYESQKELENAKEEENLEEGNAIFASIFFVESPKGVEYTVKWYRNDEEIKAETKATKKDQKDILVYELEADQVTKGTIKIEIRYKDTVLLTKKCNIQ